MTKERQGTGDGGQDKNDGTSPPRRGTTDTRKDHNDQDDTAPIPSPVIHCLQGGSWVVLECPVTQTGKWLRPNQTVTDWNWTCSHGPLVTLSVQSAVH